MSVNHTRDNHFCPVFSHVSRGLDRGAYLLDESIANKDFSVTDHTICNGINLICPDKNGLGLSRQWEVGKKGGDQPNQERDQSD